MLNTRILIARLACAVCVLCVGRTTAAAQLPRTFAVRVDNDAFDFWLQPYDRPDEEYSSGVHLTMTGGDAPWWARSFLGALPCTATTRECRTGRLEIGQDIYSPRLTLDSPRPVPGSRPNAGWLYISQTAENLTVDQSDALELTLGVTGPPSLGRQTQRIAHAFAPTFNRPTDWDRQIVFQPGVIAQYEHRTRVELVSGDVGMDFIPRIAAAAGNVRVDVEAGGEARLGWHLRHPWLPVDGPMEIAVFAGGSGRAVGRDLFVDGHASNDTTDITHLPFAARGEAGLEFRYGWLALEYRAVADSKAYRAAPRWHAWSSLVAKVTLDR